ncbi:transposase [Salmonella enterica]|nr:transposase [Salmonella enterica]
MNQKVKRTRRDHSLSFKLAVVEQVEKGEMIYCQAQNRGQPYCAELAEKTVNPTGSRPLHSESAKPEDREQARRMVRESVEIYNTQRPHLSLQYKTPDEVHRAL